MARARHRKQHRPMKVTTWLTAGATTVGVGAALLSGAAIANAKPTSDSSSSASSSSSSHSSSSSGSSSHKTHKRSPKQTDSGSSSDSGGSASSSNSGSSGGSGSDSGSSSGGSTGSSGSSAGSAAASSSSDSSSSTAAAKTTKTSKAKHSNNKHAKTDTDKKSVSTTTAAASGTSSDVSTSKHAKPATKHVAAAVTNAADTSTATTSNSDTSGSSSGAAASALAAVSASATTASSTTTTGGTSTVKTTGTRTADFSGVLSVLAAVGQALSVSARNSDLTLAAYVKNTELTLSHDLTETAKTINAAATSLAAAVESLTHTSTTSAAATSTAVASTANSAASTDTDTGSYAGTSSDPQVAQALTEITAAQAAYNAAVKKSWWASFTNGFSGYYLSVAKKDLLKYQANQDNLLAAYTANPTTKNYNALMANEKLTTSAYSALKSAASSSSISALKTNAAAASTDAHIWGTVGLSLYLTTEPIVKISINGGPMVKVLLDSGSTGLVIASKYVGTNASTMTEIGTGSSGYGTGTGDAGVTFDYTTYTTSVSFGSGITGDSVTVNVVSADTQAAYLKYIGQDGVVGVLGIGTNAVDNQVPVTSGLIGELGNGVYINEQTKTVTFGPNPLPVEVTASGTPNSTGYISINGGTQEQVNYIIDSGGVYGTIPSSLTSASVGSTLPAGTVISVYNSDHELLYTYTTTKTNTPTVTTTSGDNTQTTVDGVTAYSMNTGYEGFALGPVYIDYLNGTTTITDSDGNVSSYTGQTDYDLWTS